MLPKFPIPALLVATWACQHGPQGDEAAKPQPERPVAAAAAPEAKPSTSPPPRQEAHAAAPRGAYGAHAGPKGDPAAHAAASLARAYDRLSAVDVARGLPKHGAVMDPSEFAHALGEAKAVYRQAGAAYARGDLASAEELARAAEAAGLGLEHTLVAATQGRQDLPPPPLPPAAEGFGAGGARVSEADQIRDQLARNEDHRLSLRARHGAVGGRPFGRASERLYGAASRALEAGAVQRAHLLAMASDDLLRADEHLVRGIAPPGPAAH